MSVMTCVCMLCYVSMFRDVRMFLVCTFFLCMYVRSVHAWYACMRARDACIYVAYVSTYIARALRLVCYVFVCLCICDVCVHVC